MILAASVDLLPADHDFSVSSLSINDEGTIVCVHLNTPAELCSSLKHLIADPDTSIPRHTAATPATSFGPSSEATYIIIGRLMQAFQAVHSRNPLHWFWYMQHSHLCIPLC